MHILTPFLIASLMISSPEKEVMNDFFIVNFRLKSPAGGCEAGFASELEEVHEGVRKDSE